MFSIVSSVLDVDRQFYPAVDLRTMDGVDVTGFSSYTVATKIRNTENKIGGSRYRLQFRAPNASNGSVSAVYIGLAATSGQAYNFASTPTQVTFGGKTSLTLTAKKTFTSDPIIGDFNPSQAYIVAMNVSSSALRRYTGNPARGVTSYYKAATSEAGTVSKASGYTAQSNTAYSIILIEASRTTD